MTVNQPVVTLLLLSNLLMGVACECPSRPSPKCKHPPKTKPPPITPPVAPPTGWIPPPSRRCPMAEGELSGCVDALSVVVGVVVGSEARGRCCPLIVGLTGVDAAICFCAVIGAKLLSIALFLPVVIQLILGCGLSLPLPFHCPSLP
ncbi:cortical cell-delineating protein-like [Wolffia australiana]